ncbi:hypothetical protein M408DRAFT_23754 [Serendipita vermifera MAFF 305830]|uniref:Uncharacterized protein n=1 Tax=Serendipita vermifera MAFF 305830 TaxID=933852 RepID=A0A0C3B893_SERVB|nr:hypothetical protein M408DRAFT_23754 [Serendipita vermifera MAFF 305830]
MADMTSILSSSPSSPYSLSSPFAVVYQPSRFAYVVSHVLRQVLISSCGPFNTPVDLSLGIKFIGDSFGKGPVACFGVDPRLWSQGERQRSSHVGAIRCRRW